MRPEMMSSMRPAMPRPAVETCPRCDSTDTKFCYYNNYSLQQPRHFCRACRRFWTKGGGLRNLPVGGTHRKKSKNKKPKSSAAATTSSSSPQRNLDIFAPITDFQYDLLPFPTMQDSPLFHPITSSAAVNDNDMTHSRLASSIETLSSINQELHWKLQQQRLAAAAMWANTVDSPVPAGLSVALGGDQQQKMEIISFGQVITESSSSRAEVWGPCTKTGGGLCSESDKTTTWFGESSCNTTTTTTNLTERSRENSVSNWNGVNQTWISDMQQYASLIDG